MADLYKPFSFVGGENEGSLLQIARGSAILRTWATHAGLPPLPLAPQKPSALTEAALQGDPEQ